jgi:hypothetical protein
VTTQAVVIREAIDMSKGSSIILRPAESLIAEGAVGRRE